MSEEVFVFIGLGVLGGLARAMYGLFKSLNRGEKAKKGIFIITLLESAIIGALLGKFFDIDYHLSLLAGYVGTDIFDSIVKNSFTNKVVLEK